MGTLNCFAKRPPLMRRKTELGNLREDRLYYLGNVSGLDFRQSVVRIWESVSAIN